MPPINDNFANATVITGASSWSKGNNIDATSETGEPGNNGKTVWWKWTCPATGSYYFTTEDNRIGNWTNFKSIVQVFTANNPASPTVGALTQVTYLQDQHQGVGNGFDYGARVAFAATASTVYYIRVDSRGEPGLAGTGGIVLAWDTFIVERLGQCGECNNLSTSSQCWSAKTNVQFAGNTTEKHSFGLFTELPGLFQIIYCQGYAASTTVGYSYQYEIPYFSGETVYEVQIDEANGLLAQGYRYRTVPSVGVGIVGPDATISCSYGCPPVYFFSNITQVGSMIFSNQSTPNAFENANTCASTAVFLHHGGEIYLTTTLSVGTTGFPSPPPNATNFTINGHAPAGFETIVVENVKKQIAGNAQAGNVVTSLTLIDGTPYHVNIQLNTSPGYDGATISKWIDTGSAPTYKLFFTPMLPNLSFTMSDPYFNLDGVSFKTSLVFGITNNAASLTWPNVTIKLVNIVDTAGTSFASGIWSTHGNAQMFDVPPGTGDPNPDATYYYDEPTLGYTLFFDVAISGISAGLIPMVVEPVIVGAYTSSTTSTNITHNLSATNIAYGTARNLNATISVIGRTDVLINGQSSYAATTIFLIAKLYGKAGVFGGLQYATSFSFTTNKLDGKTVVPFKVEFTDDTGVQQPPFFFSRTI